MNATVFAHWWNLAQVQAALRNGDDSGDWGWDAFIIEVRNQHCILDWFPIKRLQYLWFQRHPQQQDAAEFYDWLRTLLPTMHQTGTWCMTLRKLWKNDRMIPLPPPPNLWAGHFTLQQASMRGRRLNTVLDRSQIQVRLNVDAASLSVWMPALSRAATPGGTDIQWCSYQCSAILLRSGHMQHSGHSMRFFSRRSMMGQSGSPTMDDLPHNPPEPTYLCSTSMRYGFVVPDKQDVLDMSPR